MFKKSNLLSGFFISILNTQLHISSGAAPLSGWVM
nr:MAG TPA: hypothetical protein [Caudoviricetes sp.]